MKLYLCLLLAVTLTLSEALAEDGKHQVSQPQNSTVEDQPEDVDEDDGEHLRGPQCPDLMSEIMNHCIKKNHEECFVCLF